MRAAETFLIASTLFTHGGCYRAPPQGDNVCIQDEPAPGVKGFPDDPHPPCMQVMCIPDRIQLGEAFHTTVRWCLSRPRAHHVSYDVLDLDNGKEYLTGDYYTTISNGYQCTEHTFELAVPETANSNANYMWKWFVTPVWKLGKDSEVKTVNDIFPNMIAEVGVPVDPTLGKAEDCPVVETRRWNMPMPNAQDEITLRAEECIQPGEAWHTYVYVTLNTRETADLRVNLMHGTGDDVYLGADDVYIDGNAPITIQGDKERRRYRVSFTARQTVVLSTEKYQGKPLYLAAFLTPPGKDFEDMFEREFNLSIGVCEDGEK